MKRILVLLLATNCLAASAQITSVTVESLPFNFNDGGVFRHDIYAELTSQDDFVSSVYGDAESPLMIGTYGSFISTYGSYGLFIGSQEISQIGLNELNNALSQGQGFILDHENGGAWFSLFTGEGSGDADNRVLLAQLWSTNDVFGVFNIQVFVEGSQTSFVQGTFGFSSNPQDVFGCTNPESSIFNPEASIHDFSCMCQDSSGAGPEQCGICSGDENADGICDALGVLGCTDASACNYNLLALTDDGSCLYLDECGICGGVGIIPGTCTCEGTLIDAVGACGGDCAEDIDADGICDTEDDCIGEYDICGLCNGPGPVYECGCNAIPDGNCDCIGSVLDVVGVCGGDCFEDQDADGICDDVDDCVGALDACGLCNGPGEVYPCGCHGIPQGYCDCEGNVVDAINICGGSCLTDFNGNGICDSAEIFGCAYELAENYDPLVTLDDGSCIFPCVGFVNQNVFDWDEDYAVTIADFLAILAVFGDVDVDSDGVWDSTDLCFDINACNYANDPSEPCAFIDVLGVCGGGCEADGDNDGVCDDIDTCIGIEDECGVCNGPGPTEIVIESIVITYDSVFLPLDNDWYVFPINADTTFGYTCAPFFSDCGDPLEYQGYDYETVQIGEQCWFAENLRAESYINGDGIPGGLSTSDWLATTSGAKAVYGEVADGEDDWGCETYSPDIDACDPAQSLNEYGRLYNWFAVDDARGLCPSGWHVPTDGEWTVMTDLLGGQSIAGGPMKMDYGWHEVGNGNNLSGFSGLPGGYRFPSAHYYYAGSLGFWWTSSAFGPDAWCRELNHGSYVVNRYYANLSQGYSVRCIKDT
jgi:uncharacterized protein (TIGR02145 family)